MAEYARSHVYAVTGEVSDNVPTSVLTHATNVMSAASNDDTGINVSLTVCDPRSTFKDAAYNSIPCSKRFASAKSSLLRMANPEVVCNNVYGSSVGLESPLTLAQSNAGTRRTVYGGLTENFYQPTQRI